jgi:hypothetical protein
MTEQYQTPPNFISEQDEPLIQEYHIVLNQFIIAQDQPVTISQSQSDLDDLVSDLLGELDDMWYRRASPKQRERMDEISAYYNKYEQYHKDNQNESEADNHNGTSNGAEGEELRPLTDTFSCSCGH